MLEKTKYVDKYAALSTARFLSVLNAKSAIEYNNKFAYDDAEVMYNFLNKTIGDDEECAFIDARMPSEEFPEWPAPEMRPVFSDEEIASWPVVFTDGSTIDDTVDVPF